MRLMTFPQSRENLKCRLLARSRSVSTSNPSQPEPPHPGELKAAMKAFRKRLKLTCLDDQSRIAVGPMSSGRKSPIVGITPPDQFPEAVWKELVRQGKLKSSGNGMYELAQP
jgi:hypothetical protein